MVYKLFKNGLNVVWKFASIFLGHPVHEDTCFCVRKSHILNWTDLKVKTGKRRCASFLIFPIHFWHFSLSKMIRTKVGKNLAKIAHCQNLESENVNMRYILCSPYPHIWLLWSTLLTRAAHLSNWGTRIFSLKKYL